MQGSTEPITRLTASAENLAASADTRRVFDTVVAGVARLLPIAEARLWVIEPVTGDPVLVATTSSPDSPHPSEESPIRLPKGQGTVGHAIETREPHYSPVLIEDPVLTHAEDVGRGGFVSQLTMPLLRGDHVLGALVLLTREPREFSPEENDLVKAFSSAAALAIDNARLYEDAQARVLRAKRLNELSRAVSSPLDLHEVLDFVTDAALDLLRVDLAGIWVVHEKAGTYRLAAFRGRNGDPEPTGTSVQFPLGHGLVGWVVEHKTRRYTPNLQEEPLLVNQDWARARGYVSQISVPLLVGERALGALMVLTKELHQFTPEDEELAEIFAANAATALENARLHQQHKEILDQLRLFHHAIRAIGEAVIITDLDGRIVFVNEAFTRMRGWTAEEVLGQSVFLHWARSAPEEARALAEIWRGEWQGELRARRKTGEEFPIFLTTAPILDEDGRPFATVGVARDLTQLKTLQTQLLQAERLEATGQLAAGVAHEINNPLSVILGFASLALQKRPPQSLVPDLDTIRTEALRAAKIIRDLLIFAHPAPTERLSVDLNEILRQTLALQAYHLATDQIDVVWDLTDPLPRTLGDRAQLQQVIMNLVLNAHQAMKAAGGRGTLRIETGADSGYVWAKLTDTGPGIAHELLPRIFDPFLTTKPVGQGTGLGLSVSYGIAQAHGGDLTADSPPGQGASFTLRLPMLQGGSEPEGALNPSSSGRRALSVLVVDDEPSVTRLLVMMFEQLGHRAEAAHSGREALAKIQETPYDLATLDLRMPQMSGQEVWYHLQTLPRRPHVLFVTGDFASEEARTFLARAGEPCLEKPFQLGDLSRKLAELGL